MIGRRPFFSSVTPIAHVSDTSTFLRHPLPAYAGQSFDALAPLLTAPKMPSALTLAHATIEDGYFILWPAQDGILFSADGTVLGETLVYCGGDNLPDLAMLRAAAKDIDQEVFVGIDCIWPNYYHWLCLTMPKLLLATAQPVVPLYRGRPRYTDETWRESIDCLPRIPLCLAPGIYRAPVVHTLVIDNAEPAYLSCFREFDAAFAPIRTRVRPGKLPRILIRRADAARLSADESDLVESIAIRAGFVPTRLEGMSLLEQADLFAGAEAVVGAHGAGLANLVFGSPALRVLEINRHLSAEAWLRPWFALIAAGRRQPYRFLNADAGDLTASHVRAAVDWLVS